MKTGENIRKRRKELHMSADVLAKKIGKDRATIYRYENGDIENMPARQVLIPLAKALKTTPAELLGVNDEYETLYRDDTFVIQAKGRELKFGAERFIAPYLQSITNSKRPTREEMLAWLRDHVRTAAFDGADYEKRDDDSLYALYKELKDAQESN